MYSKKINKVKFIVFLLYSFKEFYKLETSDCFFECLTKKKIGN